MKATTKRQKAMAEALRHLVPHVRYEDAAAILTAAKRSHMRNLAPVDAVFLATVAHIRHRHSDYDALLQEGYDYESARFFVVDDINSVLQGWGASASVDVDQLTRLDKPQDFPV
ncbi:MAG: DUF2293 domain-containing protein [Ahrensia sp.]|nr:DUF2293 domain-containing protein [Ahrensia sp.]